MTERKKYTSQFKADAVELVITSGRSIAQCAVDLGINEGTLGNWVREWRDEHPGHSVVNLSHTIALTGNFVNESNYLTVKRYLDIHGDPAWIHALPKLAQAASSSRPHL